MSIKEEITPRSLLYINYPHDTNMSEFGLYVNLDWTGLRILV